MEKTFTAAFCGLSLVLVIIVVGFNASDFDSDSGMFMLWTLTFAWALSLAGMLCSSSGVTVHKRNGIESRKKWEGETGDYDHHD